MLFYFVQRGETLFAIARRYRTTVYALVTANRLRDPDALTPGQALLIPQPGERPIPPPGIVHRVRKGETVMQLAARFGTTVPAILLANQLAHPEFLMPGQKLLIPEPPGPVTDWPVLGRTPARSANTPPAFCGEPRLRWSYRAGVSGGAGPSAPVIRYGRVYVGLGDGIYRALDQETGALVWRTPFRGSTDMPGPAAPATPAVYDGLIYLCGPGGGVSALEASSGRPVWQAAADEGLAGAPLAAEGVIYCGTAAGGVLALEAKTGARVWRQPLDGPVTQPVALGDGRLFAATEAGSLWALDALSGEVLWRQDLNRPHPPVFGELVVVAGGQAFDPLTGDLLWVRPDPGGSPAIAGESVCYPGLWVDLFTGEALCPDGQPSEEVPAAGAGGHLVAGGLHVWATPDRELVGWDVREHRRRWSVPLPAAAAGMALAGGMLILSLADNSVLAFAAGG
ncbi:MAG: PQQ-binding-like beta-propeller repeat protein [Symbiobacterium sp.]|uniref:outer membrane protein assembly factor BamB family protein n=1 Tax=Symbiobacterium sp. TaxID=1971213 RepID=UPI003463B706